MPVVLERLDDPAYAALLRDYTHLKDVDLRSVREVDEGLFLAEGVLGVRRALAAGCRPRSLLVSSARLADLQAEADLVQAAGGAVFVANATLLEALTGVNLHRGVLASLHRPPARAWREVVSDASRLVILEDVVDHTNVGAAFRSVAGLGAHGVLLSPRCADPLYRRSVRVSMSAVLTVPWARLEPWPAALTELANAGWVIAALTPRDDALDLAELAAEPPSRLALLLGTEGTGLTSRARGQAELSVRIPMAGGVDSLNVAAAAAVAMWALRPR